MEGDDFFKATRKLSFHQKCRLLFHLALALDFIHSKGIIHGDLKPENILVPKDGEALIKILDFGMAGTLAYLAPEVLGSKKPQVASDVYSFGLVAYLVLAGQLPFSTKVPDAILDFHLRRRLPLSPIPGCSPSLEKLIFSCLEQTPALRPKSGWEIGKGIKKSAELSDPLSHWGFLDVGARKKVFRGISEALADVEKNAMRGRDFKGYWEEKLTALGGYEDFLAALDETPQTTEIKARIGYLQARLHLEKGDYQKVLGMQAASADQINARGLAHFYLGEHDKAKKCFNRAFEMTDDVLVRGSAANYLGINAYNQNQLGEADEFFRISESFLSRLLDNQPLVSLWMNRGALLQRQGKMEAALEFYQNSLEKARTIHHSYLVATLLNNLANIHINLGHAKIAARLLAEVLKLSESIGARYLWAYGHLIEGDLRQLEGSRAQARKSYHVALKIFCEMGLKREEGLARANLAACQTEAVLQVKNESEDPVKLANYQKLLEVSRRLVMHHQVDELLEFIMDSVIEITGAERGFLILKSSGKNQPFKITVARNMDQEMVEKPAYKISRTIVEKVLEQGKPLLTTDAANDPRLTSSKSIQGLKLKSLLCVAMKMKGKVLGAIYVENRFQKGVFGEDMIEILDAFSDQAAIALENARLHEENHRKAEEIEDLNDKLSNLVAHQQVQIVEAEEKIQQTQKNLERRFSYENIIGESPAMERVLDVLDRVTNNAVSVLILGESGTGKELVARALHFNSLRKEKEFVAINCSAIPEQLLESELFGHVRGAFTGADRDKKGLFELVQGGTLFLDEIGDMPMPMQAKLLRALETREIRPVGGNQKIAIDVRLVSATHRDLKVQVHKKQFREDLFFRVNSVQVALPPLRERLPDIPLLVRHLLMQLAPTRKIKLTREALETLMHYRWPGNIRELRNELERAVSLADGDITPDLFSEELWRIVLPKGRKGDGGIRQRMDFYEKEMIENVLSDMHGNKSKAAAHLGISRVALYQKIKKLEIKVGMAR